MKTPALIIALVGATTLSACMTDTQPEQRLSIVTRGTEPLYQYRADGRISPTSCLAGTPAGYGSAPSACAVDSAFARQAHHPHDLVHPRQPGYTYAARPAKAAYEYIYGTMPSDGAADAPAPGVLIPVAPGGQAAGASAEE